MPTHESHPWEQDARRRRHERGRTKRRPRRYGGPILFVASLAAVGFVIADRADRLEAPDAAVRPPAAEPERLADIVRPRPRTATPPPVARPTRRYRLSRLNSRWVSPEIIEVWGRTTAPDGATIRVNVSAGGRTRRLGVAPAAHGRFYVRERVRGSMRNRRIAISARVTG
jgi:hypothetical protein